jgi:addiction module HigA family antidote
MALLENPLHPGEVLDELYLKPLRLSALGLARRMNVPRTRIERLVRGQTALSPDSALRLARVFGTSPEYWLNMQRAWDLARARPEVDLAAIEPMIPA